MKILISGGGGRFASAFEESNKKHLIIAPNETMMDITNADDIEKFILKYKPDIFLHAAALTRPLSKHEECPDISIQTNIIGTSNVVISCIKHRIKLIYISTETVYPGTKGNYKEDDPILPFNNYGWSKLGGECAVKMYANSLILRMCMNERPFSHKKALVDMKKNLIYIDEAAEITHKLLNEVGIINIGGKFQSIYDFVREENSNIEKIYLKDIKDVAMAKNASLNIDKMTQIIGET